MERLRAWNVCQPAVQISAKKLPAQRSTVGPSNARPAQAVAPHLHAQCPQESRSIFSSFSGSHFPLGPGAGRIRAAPEKGEVDSGHRELAGCPRHVLLTRPSSSSCLSVQVREQTWAPAAPSCCPSTVSSPCGGPSGPLFSCRQSVDDSRRAQRKNKRRHWP